MYPPIPLAPQADLRPRIVTLGTAGGPKWWREEAASRRTGIATAVIVGDNIYLVDCGHGVGRRLSEAGLELRNVRGIFLTHLHSDHTVDLASLAVFGLYELLDRRGDPVRIIGPGNRGMLPATSPRAISEPSAVNPANPTPGTREMFEMLVNAHATDLNDRIFDSLRPSPFELFEASDITVPEDIGYHPNENPTPEMEPFEIFRDDLVTVSAILVEHPPVAPAFGLRFDTAQGSVTFSGDTAFTPNMARLARDTELLLHEAIDFGYVERTYGDATDDGARAARDHHYKSHTSVADAARTAEEAGAKALALHHLVPGTAPDHVWQQAEPYFSGEFIVPDDLEVISFQRTLDRSTV